MEPQEYITQPSSAVSLIALQSLLSCLRLFQPLKTKRRNYGVKAVDEKTIDSQQSIAELFNTATKKPLLLNGSPSNRIPSKKDLLGEVLRQLKQEPLTTTIALSADRALPYRPGLPLSKLNHLIKQCHNTIRKIEKNEEYAFSDFSKFMFLKLLEEKWDQNQGFPPYSFTFHELAGLPTGKGDQIKTAIKRMIATIRQDTAYRSVLSDPIKLTKELLIKISSSVYRAYLLLTATSILKCCV